MSQFAQTWSSKRMLQIAHSRRFADRFMMRYGYRHYHL